ncbi:MAG: RNA 2',3'-cyclic phosphodiesterase [Methanomassiliicoccales archaeon]|nr:MAG: RNA 2',3'-cyclic phosphodiesterase [Methanomassiliicoccales archaeon]
MTFRAFISVDVEVQSKLEEFWEKLKGSNAPMKLVELENIHMTLKFLGDTDEKLIDDIAGVMALSVESTEPFTVELKGTGAFPNLNYMKVIWVGLENAEGLVDIAKTLNRELEKLGFQKEKKGFRPHVTLARVKGARNKNRVQEILREYEKETFSSQRVECIRLKKSVLSGKGPTYTTVKEVKFPGT